MADRDNQNRESGGVGGHDADASASLGDGPRLRSDRTDSLTGSPLVEAAPGEASTDRIHGARNREVQIARNPRRKLFNRERKETFLTFFAATANLGWAAEQAGVCRQTVSKHLMSDPDFAARYEEALNVSRLRLKAKVLETKKPEAPLEIDGEVEVPDIDMPLEKSLAVLREMEREVKIGRKRGRAPQVASNADLLNGLGKAVRALRRRVERRGLGQGGAPGPLHHPSGGPPPRPGEELG